MSAWYVLSTLGFYPVTPGSNEYIIGSPLFDKATINLENGKVFTIVKQGNGIYIATAKTNSKPHNKSYITHDLIMNGGTLAFEMSTEPTDWGTEDINRPVSIIEGYQIATTPYIAKGSITFSDSTVVNLASHNKDSQKPFETQIWYSINSNEIDDIRGYRKPFTIKESCTLNIYSNYREYTSPMITTQFYKYDENMSVKLSHKFANEYSAGGNNALIDGMQGTKDFRSGAWQGTQNEDLEATIDLGISKNVSSVQVGFLKDQRSWIFYPKNVSFEFYDNDNKLIKKINRDIPKTGKEEISSVFRPRLETPGLQNVRYIKMKASTYGKLPEWHLGYPHNGTAWIFIDEITIN